MYAIRSVTILASALTSMACAASPAWAIAGGGFAPGGPMSGSMRPSCNGYNMDGTLNTSPGADRPGCIDTSANTLRRPAIAVRPTYR